VPKTTTTHFASRSEDASRPQPLVGPLAAPYSALGFYRPNGTGKPPNEAVRPASGLLESPHGVRFTSRAYGGFSYRVVPAFDQAMSNPRRRDVHLLPRVALSMRATLRLQRLDSEIRWRICESDGVLLTQWLPWEEPNGCLDRGGFIKFQDALAFALGIDWVRAEAGVLGDTTVRDIDLERAALDEDRRGKTPLRHTDLPMYVAA
jgi:hypothetical protein